MSMDIFGRRICSVRFVSRRSICPIRAGLVVARYQGLNSEAFSSPDNRAEIISCFGKVLINLCLHKDDDQGNILLATPSIGRGYKSAIFAC